jgi:hypothetical protein
LLPASVAPIWAPFITTNAAGLREYAQRQA